MRLPSLVVMLVLACCTVEPGDSGDSSVPPPLPPAVIDIRGANFVCAAFAEGGVVCFGYDGTVSDVHAGRVFSYLAKPDFVACGIVSGAIDCWEMPGDWGPASDQNAAKVSDVPPGDHWLAVDQSSYSACALDAGGEVKCWGQGMDPEWAWSHGFSVPVGAGWLDITMAGDCELCALSGEGHVQCFPTADQLDNGTCREAPFGDEVYVDIESNHGQLAAIRPDGRVDMFYNASNSGIGTYDGAGYATVSPWAGNTCGLTADGRLDCWWGSEPSPYVDPVASGLTGTYTDVLLVGEDLYAIDTEGQLHWSWHDSPDDGFVSFWDAVGVPNPDDQ